VTPTRILLIDDDQVDRASVRRALARSPLAHEIVEASDGTTGLQLAGGEPFDCVLLDYRLPDVDTFVLLGDLLAPEGGKHAVIMLTGEEDQELALRLMRAGALDYLTKNEVTPTGLARAIRYARARREFVAELDTARQDAEEKSRALDTLNQQKTLLFSVVAHDLRNPFHALLGFSTLLNKAVVAKDYASVERRAKGIQEAANRAFTLMDGLLAWAHLQMDQIDVSLSDVEVARVAAEVAAGVTQAVADKGISLRLPGGDAAVRANPEMLAAVLRNLLSNAVKFTLPGGAVTVSAEPRPDGVEIAVTDTGVGIPPAVLSDLFRLDKRTTTIGTAGERGSGLGLLLCRDLVQRLGGDLRVRSGINEGATFSFRLPAARVAAPAPSRS
jgi:two-component system sensor histidine kinase/response regulator